MRPSGSRVVVRNLSNILTWTILKTVGRTEFKPIECCLYSDNVIAKQPSNQTPFLVEQECLRLIMVC